MTEIQTFVDYNRVSRTSGQPRDLSIVIRCGRDGDGLSRCLASVDENAEVIISAAGDAPFAPDLNRSGLSVAYHQYGNWSVSAQRGIDQATYDKVIIMDADSRFGPGAVARIDEALTDGHLLVQSRVIFRNDGGRLSRIVANARNFENHHQPKAYSPGLGLRIRPLVERIGINNGDLYNVFVAYGDDGDLDQRRRAAGIDVYVASDAYVYHRPLSVEHDLRAARQFGRGEYQSQRAKPSPKTLTDVVREEFVLPEARRYYTDLIRQYGLETTLFMLLCRSAYVAGFYRESRKNSN